MLAVCLSTSLSGLGGQGQASVFASFTSTAGCAGSKRVLNQQESPLKTKRRCKKRKPMRVLPNPEAPLTLFYVDSSELRGIASSNTASTA